MYQEPHCLARTAMWRSQRTGTRFFRKLEGIVVGDTIQFATVRRTYKYVVDSTETVDPKNNRLWSPGPVRNSR